MEYFDKLLSKNGQAAIALAKVFLTYNVGERVPTVTDLSSNLHIARGTIQNGMKTLETSNAIHLENRGHLGSYLSFKDVNLLLHIIGVNTIVGTMPLPYSKKYEGIATGLIASLENQYGIPVSMSYMRGAKNRISMVMENRYDFAIASKYAALEYQKKDKDMRILVEFGPGSYCSSHVVIFHDPDAKGISDGMKVGIDSSSIDQENMVRLACGNKKVQFVPVGYNTLLNRVISGEIDATVWNLDEVKEHMARIHYLPIAELNNSDTNAVLIVNSKRTEMSVLLGKMVNVKDVLTTQNMVESGVITPSY